LRLGGKRKLRKRRTVDSPSHEAHEEFFLLLLKIPVVKYPEEFRRNSNASKNEVFPFVFLCVL